MPELANSKQELFCQYFALRPNATQAYLKAYGCTYETANTESYKHLVKPGIQARIRELKAEKLGKLQLTKDDIIAQKVKMAFSDISDYIDKRGCLSLKYISKMDCSVIKKVSDIKGIQIELEDKNAALEWLWTNVFMDIRENEETKEVTINISNADPSMKKTIAALKEINNTLTREAKK